MPICQYKKSYPLLRKARFALAASLLTTSVIMIPTSTHSQQNLPSMGEPADTALSPIQEQALGDQFMRQIRASMPLLRDVQSEEYIQALGTKLALASGKGSDRRFTFFVINDARVNAFAIPGGYVGVNIGLVSAMDLEEQLAGVVAHEVAHVIQRHHARAFALSSQYSVRAAATILAAILIGQASPEAGQAALAAGIAATQQSAINFTRTNEMEADRIGIEVLSNARYNPSAMAESFAILRRKNSLNTSNNQLQYLRTHPLDNNRIAEAKDRANTKPHRPLVPQFDFQIFKARLAVISSGDAAQLQRTYQAQFDREPTTENTYGLALLHSEANRFDQATRYLDELDSLAPKHPIATLLRADVLQKQGNLEEASTLLDEMYALHPERYSVIEKRVQLHVQQRELSQAMRISKRYIRTIDNPNPLAWRQLASVQQQLGATSASHESLAQYFIGLNELRRAQSQLQLALQHVVPESKDELRLRASLKSLSN